LQPKADNPDTVPPVLPEILLLADDPNPDAPSLLANGLWYKYRTASDWGWKVWDNTVASLRQVPVMTSDISGRQACALRYGSFLLHVDQHLPSGLDDQVLQWFLGTGKGEVAALSVEAWDVLAVVLLYLSVQGALSITTILRGLVYPAWQLGAAPSPGQHTQASETFLRAANHLVDRLLFNEVGNAEGIPPKDLFDIQRIRTRRQGIYQEPHFSLLVASIPTLVSIEKNEGPSEEFRRAALTLRYKLCQSNDFRQGANRHLNAVCNTFELVLQSGSVDENLSEAIIAALGLIWGDAQCGNFPLH
jgi:mediator of RNA polymerase II transcription subunit 12, fungi type